MPILSSASDLCFRIYILLKGEKSSMIARMYNADCLQGVVIWSISRCSHVKGLVEVGKGLECVLRLILHSMQRLQQADEVNGVGVGRLLSCRNLFGYRSHGCPSEICQSTFVVASLTMFSLGHNLWKDM